MDALLTPQALAALLDDPGIRLLDATHLLGDPGGEQSRRLFHDGHIPGARFMDLDHLVDPDTGLPMMMPSPERFAAAPHRVTTADQPAPQCGRCDQGDALLRAGHRRCGTAL